MIDLMPGTYKKLIGQVAGIYTAPDSDTDMQLQSGVDLLRGLGIEGDRYASGLGSFSQKTNKVRQVSVMAIEALAAGNAILAAGLEEELAEEQKFTPEDTRRNIFTEGIEDWERYMGRIIMIGERATLYGANDCDPCPKPSKRSGKPGFVKAFKGKGGLRLSVLFGGAVLLGDDIYTVEIEDVS